MVGFSVRWKVFNLQCFGLSLPRRRVSSLLHIVIMRKDHQELEDVEAGLGSSESMSRVIVDTSSSSFVGPLGTECASLFVHLEMTLTFIRVG